MANGMSDAPEICTKNEDYDIFFAALSDCCIHLAREIAADGEGATHLISCTVQHAADEETATVLAKSVIASSLVKSAVFGRDANWGRILCALGYSGCEFDPELVDISFRSEVGEVAVCKNGRGLTFDEDQALRVLTPHEVEIFIDLNQGTAMSTCWGCDLTYEYVKINGEYRT